MNNDRRKFRVWNELCKCYDYSFSLDADGHLWSGHCSQENATFEQCTGLRDRNGKLIYEGDILENTPVGWTFHVIWDGAAWFAESDEPPLLERLNIMPLGICKVVGNIHEVKE